MASIADVRTELKDGISAVLRCFDFMPENLPFPCATVGFPSRYDPTDSLSDTATMVIPVNVYVAYTNSRAAEDNLEALLGSSGTPSVIAAIEGCGSEYGISAVRDFGLLTTSDGQPAALGCVIDVVVYA